VLGVWSRAGVEAKELFGPFGTLDSTVAADSDSGFAMQLWIRSEAQVYPFGTARSVGCPVY
jgi:hypothetical protein